jgi:hypothetical protein
MYFNARSKDTLCKAPMATDHLSQIAAEIIETHIINDGKLGSNNFV